MKEIFSTPESRRQFGEGLWDLHPDRAVDWIATAELMEAGTYQAFQDARDALGGLKAAACRFHARRQGKGASGAS